MDMIESGTRANIYSQSLLIAICRRRLEVVSS